ncbi:MAG: hypothetical protein C0410_01105 [Anaerolinea sp.]|nr:hypothetical protein [Anaerolinea sp.]
MFAPLLYLGCKDNISTFGLPIQVAFKRFNLNFFTEEEHLRIEIDPTEKETFTLIATPYPAKVRTK